MQIRVSVKERFFSYTLSTLQHFLQGSLELKYRINKIIPYLLLRSHICLSKEASANDNLTFSVPVKVIFDLIICKQKILR